MLQELFDPLTNNAKPNVRKAHASAKNAAELAAKKPVSMGELQEAIRLLAESNVTLLEALTDGKAAT